MRRKIQRTIHSRTYKKVAVFTGVFGGLFFSIFLSTLLAKNLYENDDPMLALKQMIVRCIQDSSLVIAIIFIIVFGAALSGLVIAILLTRWGWLESDEEMDAALDDEEDKEDEEDEPRPRPVIVCPPVEVLDEIRKRNNL